MQDFVEWVKKKLPRKESREVPAVRSIQRNLSADQVVRAVSKFCGVEPEEVLNRKTKSKRLRQMTMELCYRHSNLRQKQIGKKFGVDYSTVSVNRTRLKSRLKSDRKLKKFGVDYSTVSVNRTRLKSRLKSDRKLKKQFDQIQKEILNLSN
jgi:chromosomal replication initiation ATPase DnaA